MHSVSGVRVGKYITPVVGFELDMEVGMANHDKFVDHTMFGGNLMMNLNNTIHRYKGEPDRVEVVPFVGIGWHLHCSFSKAFFKRAKASERKLNLRIIL